MEALGTVLIRNGIDGMILAGMLISTWAGGLRLVSLGRARWGLWLTAVGPALILALIAHWGPITVPMGVYALALIAVWQLVPNRFGKALGSLTLYLAMVMGMVGHYGWSFRLATDSILMGMVIVTLWVLPARISRWTAALLVVGALAILQHEHHSVYEWDVTLMSALLIAGYVWRRWLPRASTRQSGSVATYNATPVFGGGPWITTLVRGLWDRWPVACYLTNATGVVVAANPAYEQLTGRTLREIVGHPPQFSSIKTTFPALYRVISQTVERGECWEGTLEQRHPSGRRWWAHEQIVPVLWGGQTLGHWGMIEERLPERALDILHECEIDTVFQPIVDLSTELPIGFEAFSRFKREDDVITPYEYFHQAAQAQQTSIADQACLERLAQELVTIGQWPSATRLFVNVYGGTLASSLAISRFLRTVTPVINSHQITFDVSSRDDSAANWEHIIAQYPDQSFALDDVGLGTDDLFRILSWPLSWVKIDSRLTHRICHDTEALQILEFLVRWAHHQGIGVLGEGVETRAQAQMLRKYGVDAAQGFLWGLSWEDHGRIMGDHGRQRFP